MAPLACRVVMHRPGHPLRAAPFRILKFSVPFCLGETHHYFNQCDLFCSFHTIVKVQFGWLAQLDTAVNNYKDNLNSLYHHRDFMLTVERALRNIVMSAYAHYIDTWAMEPAWGTAQSSCIVCLCSPCIWDSTGAGSITSSRSTREKGSLHRRHYHQ